MRMEIPLFLLLAIPLLTAGIVTLFGRKNETFTSNVARIASDLMALTALFIIANWAYQGASPIEFDLGEIFRARDYEFRFILFLDLYGAVYLLVINFLAAVIVKYCRHYLHREPGFARFFATIFTFLFGMVFLVLAGTLDLFFVGWEIVGISSFLLIAFYRDRPAPVRNALRAFSVYRFCDSGLLLGAWMAHLIWHESQHFSQMTLVSLGGLHHAEILGLSLLILLAASGKSAQFPFCFWLPRAMEGPTPSSAIFYGALSIHAGVFLLMRTFPIWFSIWDGRLAVGMVGLLSALVATISGRTQSNIKGQIAYASIAQVGLMLVELALGYPMLALFHFAANASFRCYQILVSPSVVAHLIRLQGSTGGDSQVSDSTPASGMPSRLRNSLYSFGLNDGYLEAIFRATFWDPIHRLGKLLENLFSPARVISTALVLFAAVVTCGQYIPGYLLLTVTLAAFMILCAARGFAEKKSALAGWNIAAVSTLTAAFAVFSARTEPLSELAIFFYGIVPSWIAGLIALRQMSEPGRPLRAARFQGRVVTHPGWAALLLFSSLGVIGFPITTAFLGEDLLLQRAAENHLWLALMLTVCFVLNGITIMRVFAHVCCGPELAQENKTTLLSSLSVSSK